MQQINDHWIHQISDQWMCHITSWLIGQYHIQWGTLGYTGAWGL